MDTDTPIDGAPSVSRVHWNAQASCAISVATAVIFTLLVLGGPRSLLPEGVPVCLLAFINGGGALATASKPQWRKGRWMAGVGILLPGIILALYGIAFIYLRSF